MGSSWGNFPSLSEERCSIVMAGCKLNCNNQSCGGEKCWLVLDHREYNKIYTSLSPPPPNNRTASRAVKYNLTTAWSPAWDLSVNKYFRSDRQISVLLRNWGESNIKWSNVERWRTKSFLLWFDLKEKFNMFGEYWCGLQFCHWVSSLVKTVNMKMHIDIW